MDIRLLDRKDKAALLSMLIKAKVFNSQEIDVAMELINVALEDPDQKDYVIYCLVNDQDHALGYICYGPAPMTQGTFDLYWIVVDPQYQSRGMGSKLIEFAEAQVSREKGRMLLIETSSTPEYEKTQTFYRHRGFREVGRVLDYYVPGNDRITYCKRFL
jgi:ribosomal protein S18 acetylase RimI-like enzyme